MDPCLDNDVGTDDDDKNDDNDDKDDDEDKDDAQHLPNPEKRGYVCVLLSYNTSKH